MLSIYLKNNSTSYKFILLEDSIYTYMYNNYKSHAFFNDRYICVFLSSKKRKESKEDLAIIAVHRSSWQNTFYLFSYRKL